MKQVAKENPSLRDHLNSSLGSILLNHISLSTELMGLSLVMQVTVLLLLGAVTSDSSTNGSNSTLSAVLNALAPVLELALGFLFLAGGVLLGSGAAQALVADQVADGLLGRADGLVPGSVVTLGFMLVFVSLRWVSCCGRMLGIRVGCLPEWRSCCQSRFRWRAERDRWLGRGTTH